MSETLEQKIANQKSEFVVEIKISEKNLAYKSDFSEAETIFWLEAVKNLIIKKTFEAAGMSESV